MMPGFDDIKAGARLKDLDSAGIAEVVSVFRFGPDALNLVFRVDGRVGERLVYRCAGRAQRQRERDQRPEPAL